MIKDDLNHINNTLCHVAFSIDPVVIILFKVKYCTKIKLNSLIFHSQIIKYQRKPFTTCPFIKKIPMHKNRKKFPTCICINIVQLYTFFAHGLFNLAIMQAVARCRIWKFNIHSVLDLKHLIIKLLYSHHRMGSTKRYLLIQKPLKNW